MTKFNPAIIDKVGSLSFPQPEKVIITHGSALRARWVQLERDKTGYRADIDIVTTPANIRHLEENYRWVTVDQSKYYPEDLPENVRCIQSDDGEYDVFSHDFSQLLYDKKGRGRIYPDTLISSLDARFDQDELSGFWVASFSHVALTKYGTGRKKDAADILRADQFRDFGY